MDWQELAECQYTDPELFFTPDDGKVNQYWSKAAKKICAGCLVRFECLSFSLNEGIEFGVWGGLDERDRERMVTA